MGLLDELADGQCRDVADSPLRRLDARVKLCALPLLVLAVFAASTPGRLLALTGAALLLMLLAGGSWRFWGRGLWAVRWLLLGTLLLHLLLTPGRTLFGLEWLSYDGLLRGLEVCGQLLLAMSFSSMLTLTTPVPELVAAFAALLAPLRRLRLPVEELAWLLELVLHFIPLLRREGLAQVEALRSRGEDPAQGPLLLRARRTGRMLAPLLLGLVDRADALAHEVVAGRAATSDATVLPPLSGRQRLLTAASLLGMVLLWGLL